MSWRQVLVTLICTSLTVQSSPCSWVEILSTWSQGYKAVVKLQMEETVDHWDVDVEFSENVINFEAWKGHVNKTSNTYYTVTNTCYNNMVYSCQCFELPYLVRHEPRWEGNTTFKFNGELVPACDPPSCNDTFISAGIENCCSRQQIGSTFYYLVGYEEPSSNCESGCLYTTDLAINGTIKEKCFNKDEEPKCNVTALAGFGSLQRQLTTDIREFKCYNLVVEGRYICHTNWYTINVVKDFTKFKLQCFTKNSKSYTMNGFRLVCSFDQNNRKCIYFYWCHITGSHAVPTIGTTLPTTFSPNVNSVKDFDKQIVTCRDTIAGFIYGFQMVQANANMHYSVPCHSVANTPTCQTYKTSNLLAFHYFFPNLQSHLVQCPTEAHKLFPNLQKFQLHAIDNHLHYEYDCCVF